MRATRIGAIALTGALLAGGGGAAIAAITTEDAKKAEQSILDSAAKRLNVTPQALRDALSASQEEQLDTAVKDGLLTQEQADAIKTRRERNGNVLGGPFGGGPGPHRFGPGGPGAHRFGPGGPGAQRFGRGGPGAQRFGPGGPGAQRFGPGGPGAHRFGPGGPGAQRFGPGGPGAHRFGPGGRRHHKGGRHMLFDEAAKALGLTTRKLFEQLRDGKSIADIAKAQGKSLDDVRSAVKAAAKARADKAVKDGDITQAQADEKLSRLDDIIKKLESAKPFFERRRFRDGPPRPRDGNRPGSFVPATPEVGDVFS